MSIGNAFNKNEIPLEDIIFQLLDQCKLFFFPEQWNRTFLDYSKNEIFTLFLVYRKGQVNMTEIADYLGVPLNTVTGIVSRLEKRDVLVRQRDESDKRIVVVNMSDLGTSFLKEQMKEIEKYLDRILSLLTEEETDYAISLLGRIFQALQTDCTGGSKENGESKKIRRIIIE